MFGGDWRLLDWIERVAIPFATALMRVAWVYPYIVIATNPTISGSEAVRLPAWLFFALTFGATLLAHLASESREGRVIAILTGIMACLTVIFVAVPPTAGLGGWFSQLVNDILYWQQTLPAPVVLLVVTALLWWRGLATYRMEHEDFALSFLTGAVMMIVLLGLNVILPPILSGGVLAGSMLVFLVAGLSTLAMAGALQHMSRNTENTGITLNLSKQWLLAVISVIGVVLLLGWALGFLIAPDSIRDAIAWLNPVWRLLGRIVYYILYPFIYLIFLLLQPLLNWFEGRFQARPEEGMPTPPPAETFEPTDVVPTEIPPFLDFSLRGLVAVAIIGVFLMLFIRVVQQYQPKRKLLIVEDRERIWSWDLMKEQIGSILGNLRQTRTPLFGPLAGALGDPRRMIREAYRKLLALAVEKGFARAKRDTPHAFEQRLAEMAPAARDEVKALTDAYVAARYDATPPTAEQAQEAEQAWQRIQDALSNGKAS